ncbi:hypothetical protein ABIE58_000323, partial [Roseovarius sp. MBR-78]
MTIARRPSGLCLEIVLLWAHAARKRAPHGRVCAGSALLT